MKASRVLAISVCAALAVGMCVLPGCGSSSSNNASSSRTSSSSNTSSASNTSSSTSSNTAASTDYRTKVNKTYGKGTHHAKVCVEGYDPFVITLDADDAPVTVSNFCELAKDGFYDNTTFHRIVQDFCLQGGDDDGDGIGGSEENILGEFSANGVENKLADNYARGVVAMARTSSSMNSASSQFFITLSSSEYTTYALNSQYAAFGTINEKGMKIVDKIVSDYIGEVDTSGGNISNLADQPVITSITITD